METFFFSHSFHASSFLHISSAPLLSMQFRASAFQEFFLYLLSSTAHCLGMRADAGGRGAEDGSGRWDEPRRSRVNMGAKRGAGGQRGRPRSGGGPAAGVLPAGLPPTSLPRLETKWRPDRAGAEAVPRLSEPGRGWRRTRRRRWPRRAHVIRGVPPSCVSSQNATGIQNESEHN